MFKVPKISCLMVTEGRVELLKKSVYCYTQQTYPNKELIIASQGDSEQNNQIGAFVESLQRKDIQFIEAPSSLSLGAMRNLSIELSTGSIVCQWDDDDLFHPFRLVDQYHALLNGGIASLYSQHLKYFVESQRLYWVDWSIEHPDWRRYLCGTIMFRKQHFHMLNNMFYPEVGSQSDREEDMNVLIRLSKLGKLVGVNKGYQYIYVFHGKNVYDQAHHELVLKKRVLDAETLLSHKELLLKTFDLVKLDSSFKVCSLEEEVFEYNPAESNDANSPRNV